MDDEKFYGNQHTLDEELEYDYESLVKDVRKLADDLDRPPTTRDAERDDRLPSIKKIFRLKGDKGWTEVLADADVGETQVGQYDPEERPRILADMRQVLDETDSPYLTVREYDERGSYNKSVVKRLFGSWTEACESAGVPSGRKHGRHCEGPNGEILDSRFERHVAVLLDEWGFEYLPHKPIPDTRWKCDFYLPELSLWIEVDGYVDGQRPNQASFEEKIDHYADQGMDYIVVRSSVDLEEKVFQRR